MSTIEVIKARPLLVPNVKLIIRINAVILSMRECDLADCFPMRMLLAASIVFKVIIIVLAEWIFCNMNDKINLPKQKIKTEAINIGRIVPIGLAKYVKIGYTDKCWH